MCQDWEGMHISQPNKFQIEKQKYWRRSVSKQESNERKEDLSEESNTTVDNLYDTKTKRKRI